MREKGRKNRVGEFNKTVPKYERKSMDDYWNSSVNDTQNKQ